MLLLARDARCAAITQVILAFHLVLTYDLLEDRCTIDLIITKLFPLAESFENLDIFYMIEQKICTKKHCRGIEQVREALSSRKKKDKAVSLLENGSEKILEQSAVERDCRTQN